MKLTITIFLWLTGYLVSPFNGTKNVTLSQTLAFGIFGGQNPYVGLALMILGAILLLSGFFLIGINIKNGQL